MLTGCSGGGQADSTSQAPVQREPMQTLSPLPASEKLAGTDPGLSSAWPDLGAALPGPAEALPDTPLNAFDLVDPNAPAGPEGADETTAATEEPVPDCPSGYHWVD